MTIIYKSPISFTVVFLITVLLLGVIAWEGIHVLVSRWINDEAYSHGFILFGLIVFLIVKERDAVRRMNFGYTWWGFVLFSGFVALILVSYVTQIQTLQYQAFLGALCFLTIATMGKSSMRILLPASLLVFAIPLPYFTQVALTADLQLLSSQLAANFLRAVDIPVLLEGNIIDLGEYKLQVVEACAGLNYMVPLLGLGHICAYMFKTVMWKRIFLILSCIPISILLNSARIAITGILLDVYGLNTAEGFFHSFQGWLIFVISILVLVLEMVLLNKFGAQRIDLSTMVTLFDAKSVADSQDCDTTLRAVPRTLIASLVVTSVAFSLMLYVETKPEFIPERPKFVLFPDQIGEWRGKMFAGSIEQMEVLGADDSLFSNYRHGKSNQLIELYIAYFDRQSDDKNPHSPKACLPGGGWDILSIDRLVKKISPDRSIPVNRMVIQKGSEKQMLYYWFNLHGRQIADEYRMKSYMLRDRLILNRSDGAIVRLVSTSRGGESLQLVEERMDSFLANLSPELDKFIPAITSP